MNPIQRAENLFDRAIQLGLDAPTESMVAEAISEAIIVSEQDCIMTLHNVKLTQAAEYLEKAIIRNRENHS